MRSLTPLAAAAAATAAALVLAGCGSSTDDALDTGVTPQARATSAAGAGPSDVSGVRLSLTKTGAVASWTAPARVTGLTGYRVYPGEAVAVDVPARTTSYTVPGWALIQGAENGVEVVALYGTERSEGVSAALKVPARAFPSTSGSVVTAGSSSSGSSSSGSSSSSSSSGTPSATATPAPTRTATPTKTLAGLLSTYEAWDRSILDKPSCDVSGYIVKVRNGSQVLGLGALRASKPKNVVRSGNVLAYACDLPYTVTVPLGRPSYTFVAYFENAEEEIAPYRRTVGPATVAAGRVPKLALSYSCQTCG